jgi:NAD(P)-dependent dehydrogenase (short-subunit alcohol dehydrogenase family)
VLIAYLGKQEDEDAAETARLVEDAGRRCVVMAGDLADAAYCRAVIDRAVSEFGRVDILVNNAAFQRTYQGLDEVPLEEWDYTFAVNIRAMFVLSQAAVPHMKPGSSIINVSSIQSDKPNPMLLAYASTKGAISNFTAGLAQMLGDKTIRVNAVAPGPIWTPLIPSTMPDEKVKTFGEDTPLKRPGQPAELAGIFVLLASDEGSYMNGGIYPVTGGTPLL